MRFLGWNDEKAPPVSPTTNLDKTQQLQAREQTAPPPPLCSCVRGEDVKVSGRFGSGDCLGVGNEEPFS